MQIFLLAKFATALLTLLMGDKYFEWIPRVNYKCAKLFSSTVHAHFLVLLPDNKLYGFLFQ